MKNIVIVLFVLIPLYTYGQVRKDVSITYNKNSYMFFPGDVNFVDVGSEDILANFDGNMVIVTSAIPNHDQTSLFVSSDNGGRFFFLISYNENPERYIYNYEGEGVVDEVEISKGDTDENNSLDSLYVFNDFNAVTEAEKLDIISSVEQIAWDQTRIYDVGISKKKLMFKAKGIYYDGDFIYISLELSNYSNIDYELDFVKFFMVNNKGLSKKTIQEDELIPVVSYYPYRVCSPEGAINLVYGFKKFTMSDKKLTVDLWEHRGDRRLEISVNETDILNATHVKELKQLEN